MKFNVAGVASAFIVMIGVTVLRMGDKPTFNSKSHETQFYAGIKRNLDAERKAKAGAAWKPPS